MSEPTPSIHGSPYASKVIGLAIEVHRNTGPGLLESTYEACLAQELELAGIPFQRQVPLPIEYKGLLIDCAYRSDILIADDLLIELKSVERLLPIHEAQTITYLKLSKRKQALLINFNVRLLKDGVKSFLADSATVQEEDAP
jgi:GxxExxY protein